jgi:stage V sporulation protein AB
MTTIILDLVQAFIGFAGGVAVGSGMVAFLVVLDIIPRLAQVTRSARYIHWYEGAVISGSLYWSAADFFDWSTAFSPVCTIAIGLLAGMFVGLLAAALTEVINVLPVLAKRLGMKGYVLRLLMAMIVGKVFGSLFEWLVY